MCGINGLINTGNENTLNLMNKLTVHRGPDNSQVVWFTSQNSGLGHNRLSIIDLTENANQPMVNEKKDLYIVFNGEIYNYQDLRFELQRKGYKFKTNSDTEVLLKCYEEWGINSLNKLNGMYAFAIYNINTKEFFAARDHIGIKPLYYSKLNNGLIFSSEIKAIINSGLIEKEPDLYALHTPSRYQISPYTGFKNVYKLPPAHYMVFSNGELDIKRYWTLEPKEISISENEAIFHLDYLLKNAVQSQMVADVEVGAFLSGGLDSSIIAALMRQYTSRTVKTFTIKFQKQDQKFEKMPDDSKYAKFLANQFNFEHNEIVIKPNILELLPKIIWHMDEPLSDAAAINTFLISKLAREQGIIVLLNGMGGDEIFGGYRKQLACLSADVYERIIPKSIHNLIFNFTQNIPVSSSKQGYRWMRWIKRFLSFASLPRVERFLSSDLSLNSEEYAKLFINNCSYFDTYFYNSQKNSFDKKELKYITQMCYNDTLFFLPEHNLTYSDKSTMAASIESRPPLTDRNIIEFMFTLPGNYRIKNNTQKYLLRKVAEKYLPKEIVTRPKVPFGSPIRSWIRNDLKEMVDDYLSVSSIKKRELYNPTYVEEKIKLDREGKEDNAHLIFKLLSNEIWFRTFFD